MLSELCLLLRQALFVMEKFKLSPSMFPICYIHYSPVSTSQYHNLMIKLTLAIITNLLIDTC